MSARVNRYGLFVAVLIKFVFIFFGIFLFFIIRRRKRKKHSLETCFAGRRAERNTFCGIVLFGRPFGNVYPVIYFLKINSAYTRICIYNMQKFDLYNIYKVFRTSRNVFFYDFLSLSLYISVNGNNFRSNRKYDHFPFFFVFVRLRKNLIYTEVI